MEHIHNCETPFYSDCPACRIKKAAPDLLEALKQHDEWLVANVPAVNRPAWLDKLRLDAIAKAEKP